MKTVALGDVVSVLGGGTPRKSEASYYGGGIPWVTPKDMKRFEIRESQVTLSEAGVANSPAKRVPVGSTLVVVRSGVLKHTLPVAITDSEVTLNQDMKALVPKAGVDSRFLARFLKAMEPTVLGWVRATTADNVPISKVLELPLRLPPEEEQRRIAAILDHADAVRAKRRQVLAHLGALPGAMFHQVLGESPLNSRPLGELAELRGGASLPAGVDFDGQRGGALLMRVSDMNAAGNESHIVTTTSWLPEPGARSATVGPGAVILPKRGASISTNKKRVATRVTTLDPNLMGVQPRQELVRTTFLYEWFRSLDLSGLTSGSSVPQLNKQDLAPLEVPMVPMSVQDRFDQWVRQVDTSRASQAGALASHERLFASLQSRAFRGEL